MDATRAPGRSDAELVARVLAGEREEFARLVERHQESLYLHALGMVGYPDPAADLVQDTLVKGYTSLAHCHDPSRFGAWVFRILRNRCLDYLKDRRRMTVPIHEETAFAPEDDDPYVQLEQSQVRDVVTRALAALPEAQREAFLLKHVDGFSYEEMAEMLGASVSALKMRVLRAREALQVRLRGEEPLPGRDVTAASPGSSGGRRITKEPASDVLDREPGGQEDP